MHVRARQPFTWEDITGGRGGGPWTFAECSACIHSVQLSSLATKANSALNSAGPATCAICNETLPIIVHVIVAQIGGQRQRRQGSMARDTEEMFNHRPAHSGGSPFSLSSLQFISLSVLSFSAHSCRASTGRKMYYGWVNLLINIQPLDPAFPRWPIKNYNWQRAKARQQVAVGPGLEAVTEGVGPGWAWIRAGDDPDCLTRQPRRTKVTHNSEQRQDWSCSW